MASETNRLHFVCFDCRKSFKQRGPERGEEPRAFPCPHCAREMQSLGRHFKAPPQRAVRQWEKVELLVYFGERFASSHSLSQGAWRTLASTIEALTTPERSREQVRAVLDALRAQRNTRVAAKEA